MKITVLSDMLHEHMQLVSRVVGGKQGLAIMEFALVEIQGDQLSLTTTDGETRLTTHFTLASKEGEDTSFCVRVRQLLELLKEVPNQLLEIELDQQQFEFVIRYANGFFSFPVAKSDNFPSVVNLGEGAVKISMPVANFIEGLENTVYATSTDEQRPIMAGIHIDIMPGSVTFVGTNGFLLSYYRHSLLELPANTVHKLTFQRKIAQLLLQILPKEDDGEVEMEFYTNYALFRTQSMMLQCRLLEGRYPNYESVIPTENDKFLEADRLQLLAATRRMAIFADMVSFDFSSTELLLKVSDIDFSTKAEERMPVSFSAPEARFSFRCDHLIQVLTAMKSDNISMKIGDASRAAVLTPIDAEAGVEIVIAMMPFVYS